MKLIFKIFNNYLKFKYEIINILITVYFKVLKKGANSIYHGLLFS